MTRDRQQLTTDPQDERPAETVAVGKADPTIVPDGSAAGGIGGTNDGTQIAHRPSTAVPGKPMVPTVNDAVDRTSFEGQASDTPVAEPHAERGGSG